MKVKLIGMRKLAMLLAAAALTVSMAVAQTQTPVIPASNADVRSAVELYNGGKLDEAAQMLERTIAADPTNGDAHSWLGFVYLRMGQADKAVAPLEAANKLKPNDLEVLVNLGNAYQTTSQSAKALATYEKVVAAKPDMAEAWYNIGNLHLEAGNNAKAIEALNKTLSLNPKDPFALNNRGAAKERSGDKAGAAADYAAASDLRTENAVFARNAGFAYYNVQNIANGITYLERALSAGETDATVKAVLSDLYLRAGRRADSLRMMADVEEVMSSNKAFWFNRAVLQTEAGDVQGAEASYQRALQIDGNDPDTLNNLGFLYFNQGRWAEAIECYKKLYDLNPKNRGAQVSLAAAYLRANEMDKAIELWRQIVRSQPNRDDVRLDLATALWQKGDLGTARFHFATVLRNQPRNARALNGVGMWNERNAKYTEAEAQFRAAIQSDSKFVPAYNNLAITLEKMNRRPEAIQWLERALKIDPEAAEVKANLERLRRATRR